MTACPPMPWLRHYPPGVPPRLEHQPACLYDLLPTTAARWPTRPALVTAVAAAGRLFTSSLSYARLHVLVERFAASLQRLRVQPGDRVAIALPNLPQFPIAFLGAARAGVIAVPFNPLYTAREMRHLLADSGARVVVTAAPFYDTVKQAQPGTGVERVIVTRIKDFFSPALWLLYSLGREREEPRVRVATGDLWFTSMLADEQPARVQVDPKATAVLLYTGGTTGVSRGVELSHRNLLANAEQNRVWAGAGAGTEITLAALPLFHAFGLTCGLNVGILAGATLVLVPNPRDVGGLLKAIDRLRPSIFPVVPTLLTAISNHPRLTRFDLRSLRVIPCAGSPLAPAVQREFHQRTGVQPIEGYGLTEASPTTHGNPVGASNRPGTIGVPYPGTEARIVDLEDGSRDLPFEGDWTQPGELIVKGPQVMKGYWNRPDETAAQLRDGWLHTGDIAQMHRDGFFRIVDRLKDLIIRGGLNVYPAEVEAVLLEHPEVIEASVVGAPDPLHGERVKAFVVPRTGSQPSAETLLAHCRANLARYKVPSEIVFRAGLERSVLGKPLRRLLREERAA